MSILKTPYFWISIGGLGLIGTSVVYVFSIETFGDRIGSSNRISENEGDSEWQSAFTAKKTQIKEKESQKPYSNSLDTLIQNTKNESSYGTEKGYLALKNWCISRYKDTYSSIFQKPKTQELEEIKKFCAH